MSQIAEVRIPINLDQARTMIFNMNTMAAYEEVSGKFYFDTLLDLHTNYTSVLEEARAAAGLEPGQMLDPTNPAHMLKVNAFKIVRKLPMKDMRDLIWAATHEYKGDDPYWPLTRTQVGRCINPMSVMIVINAILKGHAENSPTKKELGEAASAVRTTVVLAEAVETPHANGGVPSIALVDSDFS